MKYSLVICCALFATQAVAAEVIGSVDAKGLVFKDQIQVSVFDDPDIKGVACYITYYDRALTTSDSSSTSIACRKVAPISGTLGPRADVFSQNKNFLLKKTTVARFYDAKRNVLIYLAYTSNVGSGDKSAAHSISVVPVNEEGK